ncbi:MAG TPA: hypothetical protein VIV57_09485 [Anaeromyxobacter sp.]
MSVAVGWRWVAWGLAALIGGAGPARVWAAEAQGDATPLADDATFIALAVALSCADAPDAVAAPPPAGPSEVAPKGPELELQATVRAKALRFDEVPKVSVVFRGNGPRHTVWRTERVNLPVHPEPGVTYKDVQVRLTITSDIEELSSLLREAKRASRGVRIEQAEAAAQPAAAKPAAPKPAAAKP